MSSDGSQGAEATVESLEESSATEADETARSEPTIDVGIMVARSPDADRERLADFARQTVEDGADELEAATGLQWAFHDAEPSRLPDGDPRRPSDFLDEASVRMVAGPYDVVLVVTDAPLRSRHERLVPGLASPVSRVAVVSTHKLLIGSRDRPVRSLDSPSVRWNAAALWLHLVGHVLGLEHDADGGRVMDPFRFDPERRTVPRFDDASRDRLRRRAAGIPEQETISRGPLRRLAFHLRSAARHPVQVLVPLVRNRAPLLPLSLPKLTTAAVAPTLVLVFSAETWDVGVHLTDFDAAGFAIASVLAATGYLTAVQNLFYPREDHRTVTEHMAIVNVAVVLTVLATVVGLFAMVGVLMLAIELFVFPPDLITNWPTLENPQVGLPDLVRTAAFISTVGVLTGALAGGLESRTVIRHLALFRDRP